MPAVRPASLFPASAEQLSPLRVQRGHVSYVLYQNISIAVWVGQADLSAALSVQDVTRQMIGRFPGGHSSVSFVLDGLPAPTPEAQALLAKVFEKRSELVVAAIVLEGSGFWASGLRSMINNSYREANGQSALMIVTSIDSVVSWFSEQHAARTSVKIAPMVLRDVLQCARQRGEQLARGQD